jgi:hypothetical protein
MEPIFLLIISLFSGMSYAEIKDSDFSILEVADSTLKCITV